MYRLRMEQTPNDRVRFEAIQKGKGVGGPWRVRVTWTQGGHPFTLRGGSWFGYNQADRAASLLQEAAEDGRLTIEGRRLAYRGALLMFFDDTSWGNILAKSGLQEALAGMKVRETPTLLPAKILGSLSDLGFILSILREDGVEVPCSGVFPEDEIEFARSMALRGLGERVGGLLVETAVAGFGVRSSYGLPATSPPMSPGQTLDLEAAFEFVDLCRGVTD